MAGAGCGVSTSERGLSRSSLRRHFGATLFSACPWGALSVIVWRWPLSLLAWHCFVKPETLHRRCSDRRRRLADRARGLPWRMRYSRHGWTPPP